MAKKGFDLEFTLRAKYNADRPVKIISPQEDVAGQPNYSHLDSWLNG